MRSKARCVAALALLAVMLAGCVAGSTGKKASTTTTTSAADPEASALAAKGLIGLRDVGTGWVQQAAAKGASPPRPDDCAQRPDGPLSRLGPGASKLGASLRLKSDKHVFLYSSTLVFPNDADVDAYLAIRNSSQWHDCRQKQLDADQKDSDPRLSVVTTRQTSPEVGNGHLVAYSVFTVRADQEKGKRPLAVATARRTAYRFGRVLVSIGADVSSTKNVSPKVALATKTALQRVQRRLETK